MQRCVVMALIIFRLETHKDNIRTEFNKVVRPDAITTLGKQPTPPAFYVMLVWDLSRLEISIKGNTRNVL